MKLVPITAFSQDELLLAYLKSKINSQSNPAVSVLYKQRSTYLQSFNYTKNSRVDGPTVERWSYGSAAAVNYRSESRALHRVFWVTTNYQVKRMLNACWTGETSADLESPPPLEIQIYLTHTVNLRNIGTELPTPYPPTGKHPSESNSLGIHTPLGKKVLNPCMSYVYV